MKKDTLSIIAGGVLAACIPSALNAAADSDEEPARRSSYQQELRAWERSLRSSAGDATLYSDNFDYGEDDDDYYDFDDVYDAGTWKFSLGMEVFFGSALESLEKEFDTSADIFGTNLRFTANRAAEGAFSPEFFLLLGAGYGESETFRTGFAETFFDVLLVEFSAGADLRWKISESFALRVGGRLGVGGLYVDSGFTMEDHEGDEFDVGLAYGAGIGFEWNIGRHHALTVGLDYVGCTAEPKSAVPTSGLSYGKQITIEKQSYGVFSLGYKYTF